MKEIKGKEREFIETVWKKVRYLEYKRKEQEQLAENQRMIIRKKLRAAVTLFAVLVPVSLVILLNENLDLITLMLLGSICTGAGQIYEAWPDFNPRNRLKY